MIHCLVRRHAHLPPAAALGTEVLDENRFLAARDGLDAKLIDEGTTARREARDALDELLDACAVFADGLDCTAELDAAGALAVDPGYERQRRCAARRGLAALPAHLADEFAAGDYLGERQSLAGV